MAIVTTSLGEHVSPKKELSPTRPKRRWDHVPLVPQLVPKQEDKENCESISKQNHARHVKGITADPPLKLTGTRQQHPRTPAEIPEKPCQPRKAGQQHSRHFGNATPDLSDGSHPRPSKSNLEGAASKQTTKQSASTTRVVVTASQLQDAFVGEQSERHTGTSNTAHKQADNGHRGAKAAGTKPVIEVIEIETSSSSEDDDDYRPAPSKKKRLSPKEGVTLDQLNEVVSARFEKHEELCKNEIAKLFEICQRILSWTADSNKKQKEMDESIHQLFNRRNSQEEDNKLASVFMSMFQRIMADSDKKERSQELPKTDNRGPRQRPAFCGACGVSTHELRDCRSFRTPAAKIAQYQKVGRCIHCDRIHTDICRLAGRKCQLCPERHFSGICAVLSEDQRPATTEISRRKRAKNPISGVSNDVIPTVSSQPLQPDPASAVALIQSLLNSMQHQAAPIPSTLG
ncbi:unnamed protein product [Caenorhabditis sp. 36 PRJEB53466]|nr:unnamed protein product [Caenorhabditis sp. 36 PRJEB53466]